MRARKTQLITELEQEKQRLETEVRSMQKLKETKVVTKGKALVIVYRLVITTDCYSNFITKGL